MQSRGLESILVLVLQGFKLTLGAVLLSVDICFSQIGCELHVLKTVTGHRYLETNAINGVEMLGCQAG